ncbi:MAG: acyl-CoA synthetase [Acidobacteria bacterium]|nr:MAG: acyl-CoA synthetase [Acidobacteriota bacterium]
MSLLTRSAIRALGQRESRRLDRSAIAPAIAQQHFLFRLLAKNAETSFGRKHGFASIRTEADYRRRVPIRDYEEFRPYITRMMKGEQAVLTAAPPVMFTMTSGTTSEPKFIPVTRESQSIESALTRQWFYLVLRDHQEFMDHAGVGIVSKAVEGFTPSGIPYGSASGMTYKNIPWLIRRVQAIPYEAFEILDYDQRYFVMARFAIGAHVSFIATPNPSTLVRLARTFTEHSELLVRAIHDGTLGVTSSRQPKLFARLQAWLKPDPARARILNSLLNLHGALYPRDIWPTLALIGCWVGGSVGLHARKLNEYYGDTPIRDLGYMASEGHFTVPCADRTAGGILALNSNYYEFIPEEQTASDHPDVCSSHELEDSRRYSIVLSTANGLYRYRINDIVEVTGHHKRAPLLAFVRKEGEMANITGEKIHVNHLLLAVAQVRRKFNLAVEQFRATPDYLKSRYEIFLELSKEIPRSELHEILLTLDGLLSQVNIEYEQKRTSGRLRAPCLHIMQRGWAERAHRRLVAGGKRDTQYKWQTLSGEQSPADREAIGFTIEAQDQNLAARCLEAAA